MAEFGYRPHPNPSPEGEGLVMRDKGVSSKTPPLQGRGKGWGLSRDQLAELHKSAREMRNNPTEPEKRLWRNLSNARLAGSSFAGRK